MPKDKIESLFHSFKEIFIQKNPPENWNDLYDVIPFFHFENEREYLKGLKGRPAILINPPPKTIAISDEPQKPIMISQSEEGDSTQFTIQGSNVIWYLPFHFFYTQQEFLSHYTPWGLYVVEDYVRSATSIFDMISTISKFEKYYVLLYYFLYFGIYYHKIECFVTRLEIAQRKSLYSLDQFKEFKKNNQSEIDRLAHKRALINVRDYQIKNLKGISDEQRILMVKIISEYFNFDELPKKEKNREDEAKFIQKIYNEFNPSDDKYFNIWLTDLGWLNPILNIGDTNNIYYLRKRL